MIDLEKQKEPSEEEIQEWVNEVYEYAVNLYTNHNMSWGEVRQELINQGPVSYTHLSLNTTA